MLARIPTALGRIAIKPSSSAFVMVLDFDVFPTSPAPSSFRLVSSTRAPGLAGLFTRLISRIPACERRLDRLARLLQGRGATSALENRTRAWSNRTPGATASDGAKADIE
jgi:hypothetical protein